MDAMNQPVEVVLYTDGACSRNPGPGGWAYILKQVGGGASKKCAGGDAHTTNNKMELRAVIEGLRALKRRTRVRVITDSQYVSRGMTEWVKGWMRNGWRRGRGPDAKPVKNVELWQELVRLCAEHDVRFEHVRGHSGHPENEECDRMAVAATRAASRHSG